MTAIDSETCPYVQVLVDLDAKALDRRTFSYGVPEGMSSVLEIGMPVSVPFGRMKMITGYVVGFSKAVDPGLRIKEIVDVLDEEPLFDLDFLQFLDWVAHYYGTPLLQVLSAALPSSMSQKTRREVLLESTNFPPAYFYQLPRPAQKIVAFLKDRPLGKGVRVRYLSTQTGIPLKLLNQTLYKLQSEGVLRVQSSTTQVMAEKRVKWVRVQAITETMGLSKRQQAVFDALQASREKPIPFQEALIMAQTTAATLQKMQALGCLEIFETVQNRDQDPLAYYASVFADKPLVLNAEQESVVSAVLAAQPASEHLLYGITGAGKTEVYLALTEATLKAGKSVLILVPEISLTSHIAKRFIERFGLEQMALWHSHLSAGEKVDTWRRIHRGELKIVIGARSAIFTPLQQLGLIVMDEAHDGSFKQDSPAPRYHAKTLAQQLVKIHGAKLLLGSATPDVESFYEAQQYRSVLYLTQRYGGRSLAEVAVVDMHQVRLSGHSGPISGELQRALEETVCRQEQAIILLNRRGFYTLVTCNQCEAAFQCPHCSVALTYHRYREQVRCHYCGYEADKPQYCPKCASFKLSFTGTGTQRLEEQLQELLPEARLLRLDSDVMQKKFAHRDIFTAFENGEADILIGTQMVAKGLDIPNVTLVGVVGADTTFSLPDYKATERGFQLLTQVAGRSGRGERPGRVVIQSFQPTHPVILRAKDQDYEGFYQDELIRRQAFDFPPYSQLFRFIASCPDEFKAHHFMKAMTLNLQQIVDNAAFMSEIMMLGPAPCAISRIQGRYRFHVMIKNKAGSHGHRLITQFYTQVKPPDDINFLLDVDAQSFL